MIFKVCTPTIEKDCHKVKVKSRSLETRESCVDVVRTVCEETEEVVDNEVCYYVYNKESQDTEASTVEVNYEVKCEEETVNTCPPQSGYGYNSYCKNKKMDVCYNVPKVTPAKTSVTVSFPVAEKKCENKPVKIPKVTCSEKEVIKQFLAICTLSTIFNSSRIRNASSFPTPWRRRKNLRSAPPSWGRPGARRPLLSSPSKCVSTSSTCPPPSPPLSQSTTMRPSSPYSQPPSHTWDKTPSSPSALFIESFIY